MSRKQALGKGIGALLGGEPSKAVVQEAVQLDEKISNKLKEETKPEANNESGILMIDISTIKMNDYQPRKIFKDKELKDLSQSIIENGVLQPLIVKKSDKGYELIAGERRLRASKLANLKQVPVIVKNATDKEKLAMAIIENVQRSDLNCVEEALAYYQLMQDFKLTQEEVAKKIGKDRSTIANFLRILNLPRPVIDLLQKEFISFGHGKVLVALKDNNKAIKFAEEAASKNLSVRELEKKIKSDSSPKNDVSRNPFFDEKLDQLRENLEKSTGFHFQIKSKDNGSGQVVINYTNEAEFNDIYDYILKK